MAYGTYGQDQPKTYSDEVIRRLKPETFSGKMRRMRWEKATPEERAEVAAKREQLERLKRIEQMQKQIDAMKAASDEFYRK